jgi:hypothetical protein
MWSAWSLSQTARTRRGGTVGRERREELHPTWGASMKATEGDEIRYQREYLTDAGPVPRGLPGTCLCS